MLMLNLMNQDEIFPRKKSPPEKCESPISHEVTNVYNFTYTSENSLFNPKESSKKKSKSKFSLDSLEEKLVKENAASSGKSVSSFYSSSLCTTFEANYEKKISSLNKTIMKLNETLEKYIRKISSQEKEIQFINKRLREAENLNIKMLGELSNKNQAIESLNKQMKQTYSQDKLHRRRSKKECEILVFPKNFESTSEVFINEVSELFLKELAAYNIKAIEGNTSFENYFDEVKIHFSKKNNKEEGKSCNIRNSIEVELSNNLYLKTLFKELIIKSKKLKQINSMKIIKTQYQNTFNSSEPKLPIEEDTVKINKD